MLNLRLFARQNNCWKRVRAVPRMPIENHFAMRNRTARRPRTPEPASGRLIKKKKKNGTCAESESRRVTPSNLCFPSSVRRPSQYCACTRMLSKTCTCESGRGKKKRLTCTAGREDDVAARSISGSCNSHCSPLLNNGGRQRCQTPGLETSKTSTEHVYENVPLGNCVYRVFTFQGILCCFCMGKSLQAP